MRYGEIAPHPALRQYVRTYWWLRGPSADAVPQPVMPDGTTELIVHRGRPFRRYLADGIGERQAPFLFAGQMQAPAVIHPDGEADVVSVRFAPHGAFALLGLPQRELTDQIADAASFGLPWLSTALRESQSADTTETAIRRIETALIRRLAARIRTDAIHGPLATAVGLIDAASGAIRIADVAARAGIDRRRLERAFESRVGLTPKGYARVIRFQTAASRIAAEPVAPLVTVSADSGYCDQSHMIRDFLSLAGRSPAEFRRHLGGLTAMMLSRG